VIAGNTGASGAAAEQRACRFLRRKGLKLITRNFRCRFGEIDLIMLDSDNLVFVEVRFRDASQFTRARATVNAHKRHKLIRTGAMFLATCNHPHRVVRFDVVAIDRQPGGSESIEWIRDAFRPQDASL
jgi:putative endonuclease